MKKQKTNKKKIRQGSKPLSNKAKIASTASTVAALAKGKALKSVPGYEFAGLHCGLKTTGQKDLGLIVSEVEAKAVACFTTNQIQAAPVTYGKNILSAAQSGKLSAILVNSGNANAVTGKVGLKAVEKSAVAAGKVLDLAPEKILVSSTGKIGELLPTQNIVQALPRLSKKLSPKSALDFAEAIRTTDRFAKVYQLKGKIRGKSFHVTGIAKGAGMIEPNMATMLAYVMTDLEVSLPLMRKIFRRAVGVSFNAISVDGDMSTNDTAVLLSNGVSGISLNSAKSPGVATFQKMLTEVCQKLAWMMVQDGEGATKVVEIKVTGARNHSAARHIAYTIARSQLVKTSFFGKDPNWGRIIAAVGYSGETLDPQKVDIFYGPHCLVRKGLPTSLKQEQKAHRLMKGDGFEVRVNLHGGPGEARVLTSDLGYEYIRINSEYRT